MNIKFLIKYISTNSSKNIKNTFFFNYYYTNLNFK